jgi:hypothetical protein
MHDDFPERVFKASERPGVKAFEPRPFWHQDGFARSGSAADPTKVPPGAEVVHGCLRDARIVPPVLLPAAPLPAILDRPGGK